MVGPLIGWVVVTISAGLIWQDANLALLSAVTYWLAMIYWEIYDRTK